jgi:hypothetical protein
MGHKASESSSGQINSDQASELPDDGVTLSAETMKSKIERAKGIIAGTVQPQAMVTAPAVKLFLERELKTFVPPATPEAIQKITDSLNLQAHYGGRSVACFTTIEGVLAVLACGDEEIDALLKSLSPEDAAKVLVEHPDPPMMFNGRGLSICS